MGRLNLTLDESTLKALDRYARVDKRRRAALARDLIAEALSRRSAMERRRKWAADYAAATPEDLADLREWEAGQLDLLDDDE
jgi:metal-responsive CopG/Arc/MetJ family transcriptional regulator